jgi:hypothetical protein
MNLETIETYREIAKRMERIAWEWKVKLALQANRRNPMLPHRWNDRLPLDELSSRITKGDDDVK